jgi:hypothetical protein
VADTALSGIASASSTGPVTARDGGHRAVPNSRDSTRGLAGGTAQPHARSSVARRARMAQAMQDAIAASPGWDLWTSARSSRRQGAAHVRAHSAFHLSESSAASMLQAGSGGLILRAGGATGAGRANGRRGAERAGRTALRQQICPPTTLFVGKPARQYRLLYVRLNTTETSWNAVTARGACCVALCAWDCWAKLRRSRARNTPRRCCVILTWLEGAVAKGLGGVLESTR